MTRKIIVVTAAYGHDRIRSLGGQAAVLPIIAAAGADGVEIRRELLSPQDIDRLPPLATAIAHHNLLACYSAPEALFTDDGSLNPRLPALLDEAHALNALWLKLSLGHFRKTDELTSLRTLLAESPVPLVIENDQSEYGRLAPMQRFLAAIDEHSLPVRLTFDMGNWIWLGESPEQASRLLAPGVDYVHVKAAEPHHAGWRAGVPDRDPRWAALLDSLPGDVPRGIEFPLEGDDLVAVTRHYVRWLREE
ncbi:sugar phosphate isomerase/epimerase [Scandinavium sp.]|uniref:sugar phosphate isomerase/epimerase family protein n=1 Tax=Scandinavium sp. TaxID=2830653 RepID=UPI00289BD661|nr:sugar phosphate isomerase/epimerase [Scandinavium sp.]